MNELLSVAIAALGLTLLHFLWQGLLIGAIAALALRALGNARPQARYAVACLALLSCLLAAVATLSGALMPASSLDSAIVGETAQSMSRALPVGSILGNLTPTDAMLAPWLVAFWSAGSGLQFLRLALGFVAVRRLRLHPPAPPFWQARLDQLAQGLGLRPVALLLIDGFGSPLSAGCWRPIVLLPVGLLTRLPVAQIEALLAHELAHIRRHDYAVNVLQVAIEALLFYHPVVWWLSKQIRLEREHIADQLAVTVTAAPRPLALALAALAELQVSPHAVLAQAGSGGALKTRIERLLRPKLQSQRLAAMVLPTFGLAIATLSLIACAHVASGQPETAALVASNKPARLSYALVRADAAPILAWGPDDEIDQVARDLPPRATDFVLVRRNGRDGLVTDEVRVAQLRQSWEHAEKLAAQVDAMDESPRTDNAAWQRAFREQQRAYQHLEDQLREEIATAPGVAL